MNESKAQDGYFSPALPRILAHRGFTADSATAENTIEAFRAALELGATHLESDIQVTKDGVPVLFHDDDLLRVAGLPRKISEIPLAELRGLSLISGGKIPTLREALVELPTARFNLDLKVWGAVVPAVELIRELGAQNRVLVSSFSDRRRAKAIGLFDVPVVSSAGSMRVLALWLAAKLRLSWLIEWLSRPIQALQIPVGQGPIRLDSPDFIARMKVAGLELHYWTINEADEMLRLVGLGADGIVTDRTDIAVKTLRKPS
jgi:glycerophosphoryl diester phosphodiesterase